MQKISEKICLIVLMAFVTTRYMAQAMSIQGTGGNDILHHLVKRHGLPPDCTSNNMCSTPECCKAFCMCALYKTGLCKAFHGAVVQCFCTNNYQVWVTPPNICPQ